MRFFVNGPVFSMRRPPLPSAQVCSTPREREVMLLVTAGKTSKEVARVFAISPRTVEIHCMRLMDKMRVRSLADLVHMAIARRPCAGAGAGGLTAHAP
ncbi:MAG: LuxR family transcriptional regulator [Burkholderiales bacterium]|nr:LuxR family transcriptional regulator [Burkholderiales bacterium]